MLRDNKWLVVTLVLLVLIYLITFPSFYASGDEHSYIKTAALLSEGKLFEDDLIYAAGSVQTDFGFVSNVPVNFPFFLIPFVLLGFPLIFLFGLVMHLLNTFIFSNLLREFKIPQKFVLLYAFFPSILWLSRTLYPQTLAITFLMAGFLVYTKYYNNFNKKYLFLSGLLFGIAVFVRADLVVLLILFLTVLLIKKKLNSLPFIVGCIPPAITFILLNLLLYGGAFATGYGATGASLLIRVFTKTSFYDLFLILGAFIFFYPLMLFSIFYRGKNNKFWLELVALVIGGLLIQSSFGSFSSIIINPYSFFFLNIRYISIAIPFLILLYAIFLHEFLRERINYFFEKLTNNKLHFIPFDTLLNLFFIMLFIICFAFSFVHFNFVNDRHEVLNQIYATVPEGALVIGSSDDKMFFIDGVLSNRRYIRMDTNMDIRNLSSDFNLSDYMGNDTYIMLLSYSNRESNNSERYLNTIKGERKVVLDFIEQNKESVELIFESSTPHNLIIYRWHNE